MRFVYPLFILVVLVCGQSVVAEPLSHQAENNVPVAMVKVVRTPGYTEAHLQTQAVQRQVCWSSAGPNSPYLLAAGHRYRLVGGENITDCPTKRDYTLGEIMVLRFEPLGPQVQEFSLVEGEGGENQMADPASSRGTRYWNFLHVQSK